MFLLLLILFTIKFYAWINIFKVALLLITRFVKGCFKKKFVKGWKNVSFLSVLKILKWNSANAEMSGAKNNNFLGHYSI